VLIVHCSLRVVMGIRTWSFVRGGLLFVSGGWCGIYVVTTSDPLRVLLRIFGRITTPTDNSSV
jgi:predicted DNA-binding transcriptional regulator